MLHSVTATLERKRSGLDEKERGFTLIELLVVVIIIGILAAIAIPIFLSQQNQAKDSAAKSDLASAKVSYVSRLLDTPAGTTTIGDLTAYGFVRSADVTSVTIKTGGTSFCIDAVSGSTAAFSITNSGGVAKTACP